MVISHLAFKEMGRRYENIIYTICYLFNSGVVPLRLKSNMKSLRIGITTSKKTENYFFLKIVLQ